MLIKVVTFHNPLTCRHYRRHTGYRPFKCPHCSSATRFARSDHLRSHVKNRHPGLNVAAVLAAAAASSE